MNKYILRKLLVVVLQWAILRMCLYLGIDKEKLLRDLLRNVKDEDFDDSEVIDAQEVKGGDHVE